MGLRDRLTKLERGYQKPEGCPECEALAYAPGEPFRFVFVDEDSPENCPECGRVLESFTFVLDKPGHEIEESEVL